jgi:hypothetical protein
MLHSSRFRGNFGQGSNPTPVAKLLRQMEKACRGDKGAQKSKIYTPLPTFPSCKTTDSAAGSAASSEESTEFVAEISWKL